MAGLVAKLLVPVALSVAAFPVEAYSGDMGPSRTTASYNAFYDDHYGPFYNGYWSISNSYYFTTGPGRPYVRDDGRHFSRVRLNGYHPVEGAGPIADDGATALR